ncbi:MAG: calcineurin-like phosphoesterase family protein [Thermoflexibacter sp.]
MENSASRRRFLKQTVAVSASLWLADMLYANPYQPLPTWKPQGKPVKIQGIVRSKGKGIAGVAISDGRSVVQTAKDGTFTLIADGHQPFAFISVPSGYEIPTNPTGTALFYKPILANSEQMKVEWDLAPVNQSDSKHGFLVLADPQTLDMDDMRRFQNETAVDVQNFLKGSSNSTFFNVACGDIMFDNLSLYSEYEKAVKQMGIPAFQVVGNHDLDFQTTDENSVKTFQQFFGPNYYSFNRGEVHYVVLDDVFYHGNGYMGYLDQPQLDWLKADLSAVEKGKTVVVFTHIPPYTLQFARAGEAKPSNSSIVTNRQMLYRLLEGYKAHIIAGHMHFSERLTDGNVSIYVAGAACGAWWTGDICYDGTPNGYAVYEVDGSQFTASYKTTGKPIDHQMRLYGAGSDKSAPNEFIANIWDADNTWKIFWYEDGMKKGMMAQRIGSDPLSVEKHFGNKLPQKHTWVEPQQTSHLYYAPFAKDAKEIRIEAISSTGKTYSQVLG